MGLLSKILTVGHMGLYERLASERGTAPEPVGPTGPHKRKDPNMVYIVYGIEHYMVYGI